MRHPLEEGYHNPTPFFLASKAAKGLVDLADIPVPDSQVPPFLLHRILVPRVVKMQDSQMEAYQTKAMVALHPFSLMYLVHSILFSLVRNLLLPLRILVAPVLPRGDHTYYIVSLGFVLEDRTHYQGRIPRVRGREFQRECMFS